MADICLRVIIYHINMSTPGGASIYSLIIRRFQFPAVELIENLNDSKVNIDVYQSIYALKHVWRGGYHWNLIISFFWKIWVEVVVIRKKESQESTENSFCVAKNSNWTVWSLPLAESAEYSGACALVWCPRKPFNTINHLSGEEAKRQFNVGV